MNKSNTKTQKKKIVSEYLCDYCGLTFTLKEFETHRGIPHPEMRASEGSGSVPIGSKNMRFVKDEDL